MEDYSKTIIDNIDTYFIVVDKDGIVISHSDGALSFLGVRNIVGKNIEDVANIVPENIWEEEIENVEILWKGERKHYEHLILQSIPFKEGYILCFRTSKPPRMFITDVPFEYQLDSMIGISNEIKRKAQIAAEDKNPVLITGETGVGKEILARAIHNQSGRKGHFIPINCIALPNNLAESELFGYEPGTFTGAARTGKTGKFELADGGTIFFDEMGDMSPEMQGKLLRVIEDKKVWRIGAKEWKKVDFKLICATNKDIKELIKKKIFREDLYYRIRFHEIYTPPLRERLEFLRELVEYFLSDYRKYGIGITEEALDKLKRYNWPGNIRELKNVIERLAIEKKREKDKTIKAKDLPEEIINQENKLPKTLIEKIEEIRRKEIEKALKKHNGNRTKAAEELGISRRGLTKMLKRLKLET